MPNPVVQEGDKAPDFTLRTQEGHPLSLSDQKGWTVLYFYPRDNTPGCTTEASDFNERLDDLTALGATIVGISPDSVESHARFRETQHLRFTLLSDDERDVAERYGVWREKNMYGRKMMGIVRSTFLIDSDRTVRKVWDRVRVKGHVDEVVATLKQLTEGA